MKEIKEREFVEEIHYTAKWICPYCEAKNIQQNVLRDRWKCWKCGKYSLKKKQKEKKQ